MPVKRFERKNILIIATIVALSAVATFLIMYKSGPQIQEEDPFVAVQELIQSGKLKEAAAKLEALAKEKPNENRIPALQGSICLLRSKPKEAIPFLEHSFTLGNRERALVTKLGESYMVTGQLEKLKSGLAQVEDAAVKKYFNGLLAVLEKKNKKALDIFKGAESELKDYYPFQVNLADCYFRAGDNENGVKHYEAALKLQPALWHVADKLANHYLANKDIKSALKCVNDVIRTNEFCLPAYEKAGDIFLEQKIYRDAKHYFEQMSKVADALSAQESLAHAEFKLGTISCLENKLHEAEPHFQKALKADKENHKIQAGMAGMYFMAEKYDDAILYSTAVLDKQPKNSNCLVIRGRSYVFQNKIQEAIKDLKEAVGLDSRDIQARLVLADLLVRTGDKRGAFTLWENADFSQLPKPMQAQVEIRKGAILLEFGKEDAAQEALKKAQGLDSEGFDTLVALADIYSRYDQTVPMALELAGKATLIKPGDPQAQYVLGFAQFKNKNYPGAIKTLEETIPEKRTEKSVYCLGMSYFQSGNLHKAKEVLEPLRQKEKYNNNEELRKVFSVNQ